MLKRRSSVSNCCRIESSNRLNSIFIKFNFFIFQKYFCKGGPGPWGPPPRSATGFGNTMIILSQKVIRIRKYPTFYIEARYILNKTRNFTEAVASVASYVAMALYIFIPDFICKSSTICSSEIRLCAIQISKQQMAHMTDVEDKASPVC